MRASRMRRLAAQAALTARAAERNLPRDWPARFFRIARRQRNEPREPVDPAS